MANTSPKGFKEIKTLRKPLRNINVEHRERLTQSEKMAIWVTNRVGTMDFFLIVTIWTIIWLGWNTLGPAELRFDPFPAFVLWLFVSNVLQLILLPLIMVGQNLQARHSEARAEADFEINTRSEREIEAMLENLENQNEMIQKILKRLEGKR